MNQEETIELLGKPSVIFKDGTQQWILSRHELLGIEFAPRLHDYIPIATKTPNEPLTFAVAESDSSKFHVITASQTTNFEEFKHTYKSFYEFILDKEPDKKYTDWYKESRKQ